MWRIKRKTGKIPPRRLPSASTRLSPADSHRQLVLAKRAFSKMRDEIRAKDQRKAQIKAAVVLWRFWRQNKHMSLAKIIQRFKDGKLMSSDIKRMQFEDLVVFLRQKDTISKTKALLMRFHNSARFAFGDPTNTDLPDQVNVRVFLAAYMMVYFSSKVFEEVKDLEAAARQAATRMIGNFERMIEQYTTRGQIFYEIDANVVASFVPLLFNYLRKFKEWKVPDEIKLIGRIKCALVALYLAQEALPSMDESERPRMAAELSTQIDRLRGKYRQIAGNDEYAKFEDEYRRGDLQHLVPRSQNLIQDIQNRSDARIYLSMRARYSNEELAHELLLDHGFRLNDEIANGCENAVIKRINDGFWGSIANELQIEVPCYVKPLRVLAEIRDGIVETSGQAQETAIKNIIDVDHIKARIDVNAFNWTDVITLGTEVVRIIKRVQAPSRDIQFRDMWSAVLVTLGDAYTVPQQAVASANMLRVISEMIGYMRIDASNTRLRLIAPVIRDHGIKYEQDKFQGKIDSGAITVDKTKAYLKMAIEKALVDGISIETLKEGNSSAYMKMLTEVFLYTIEKVKDAETIIPETLILDKTNLTVLHNELNYQALIATALSALKANFNKLYTPIARASGSAQFASEAVTLTMEVVNGLETKIQYFSHDESEFSAVLKEGLTSELSKTPLTEEQQESLIKDILNVSKTSTPVFVLLKSRITEAWRTLFRKGVIVPDDVKDLKYNKCVTGRILDSCTRARRIFDINIAVHGERYNGLIHEALSTM